MGRVDIYGRLRGGIIDFGRLIVPWSPITYGFTVAVSLRGRLIGCLSRIYIGERGFSTVSREGCFLRTRIVFPNSIELVWSC